MGRLYAEKYFPPAAKARVEAMVKNLMAAFGRRMGREVLTKTSTRRSFGVCFREYFSPQPRATRAAPHEPESFATLQPPLISVALFLCGEASLC